MKKQISNLQFVGSFATHSNEPKQIHKKKIKYSQRQNELYGRLLVGLNYYPEEVRVSMNSTKKKRILKAHKKTQQILNQWKHELTIQKSNAFFMLFFPQSDITKALLKNVEPVDDFKNTLTFKELGLTKVDIVEKLKSEKLLPHNFDTL